MIRRLLSLLWHVHEFELRHVDANGERWLRCECGKERPMLAWSADDKRRRDAIEQRIAASKVLLFKAQKKRLREARTSSGNVVPMPKREAK